MARGNFTEVIERQELLQRISESCHRHAEMVEVFLLNENLVYTKGGRLNKSGACRLLKCKPKDLEQMLLTCRELIQEAVD